MCKDFRHANKPDLPVVQLALKMVHYGQLIDLKIENHGLVTHAAVPDAGVESFVASCSNCDGTAKHVSRTISSSHNASLLV